VRFLADMGVAVGVVAWLNATGHDARHLRDEGLQRLPNGGIFEKAHREARILLTFDLDFGEIAALARGNPVSVVVFRLHNTRSAHVIARLKAALEASSEAFGRPGVIVIEEARHRIRRFPIGAP
jgi:predicted nuclease of predicted toxin-antitoxin system